MTNGPTRLIHEDPDFARLVTASSAEEPSSDQLAKALAIATGVAAASRWSLHAWRGSLGSRLAIGVAILGVAAIGVATMRDGEPTRDSRSTAGAVATSLSTAEASRAEPAVRTVSVDDLADAPPVSVPAQRPSSAPRTGARSISPEGPIADAPAAQASPGGQGTFREELALVSAARAALESGDARACLRAVDRYDERFRSGIFSHEIEVLRIEAIAASGDRARARSLAEGFLAVNAKSPYADRVRSLVERTQN